MNACGNIIEIHENLSGSIDYCSGCCSYHLMIKGMLTLLNQDQLNSVEVNLNQMKTDLITNYNNDVLLGGVQIKLAKNVFLCLNFQEISNAIELIEMGSYMQNIQDIVNP